MADINIQRRSSHAVWWVLGLIALIVIAWMVWSGRTGTTGMSSLASDSVVAELNAWVESA